MKLRDQLLDALKDLSGTRTFHLHVLVSSPRKYFELYPYATTRHRVYAQDILILCSEQASISASASASTTTQSSPSINVAVQGHVTTSESANFTSAAPRIPSTPPPSSAVQSPPRVLVTAIEASLYTIPATGSLILYIAKVDSTGQGLRTAGSSTRALVRALILHYLDPNTRPRTAGIHKINRVWVHLFARAQAQYLFPNSAEHPAKKALGDVQLCRWWRALIAGAVKELAERRRNRMTGEDERASEPEPATDPKPLWVYYVLPGMNELEAFQALGGMATVPAPDEDVRWVYGHPYAQTDVPLPYVAASRTTRSGDAPVPNLGQLIPSFDDDPKTRFLDEIAHTTKVDGVMSPSKRKRRRTSDSGSSVPGASEDKQKEKDGEYVRRPPGELGIVNADEFWERMSFRQECVAGAVTGFFVIASAWPAEPSLSTLSSVIETGIAQPGEVSHQLVRRVVTSLMTGVEFSTTGRTVKATAILESAIRSLCTPGTAAVSALTAQASTAAATGTAEAATVAEVVAETTGTVIATCSLAGTGDTTGAMPLRTPCTPLPAATRRRRIEDDEAEAEDEAAGSIDIAATAAADTYESYVYGSVTVDRPVAGLTTAATTATAQGAAGALVPSLPSLSSLSGGARVLTVKRRDRGGNSKR